MLSRRMADLRTSTAPCALAVVFWISLAQAGLGQEPAKSAPAPVVPAPVLPTPMPTPIAPTPEVAKVPATHKESGEVRLELTLEQALKIALDNDLGLEIEAVSTEVARYEYAGSWGSFDPRLTASAGVTDSQVEAHSSLSGASVVKEDSQDLTSGLVFPLSTGGEFDLNFATTNVRSNNSFNQTNPSTTDSLGVTFRQPLWRGGWEKYATTHQRESEILYRKSVEHFRQTRQELLYDVNSAYWDLRATIELLGVADATLELGRSQLQQNQRRLDAGVGTGVEVLQAEANVAVRVGERLLADVNARTAQDKLKAKLFPGTDKVSWDTQIAPVTPLPESTSPLVPGWDVALLVALEHRSELRQQRLEIDASNLRLERAGNERRFGLDLLLSSTGSGFDGDSWKAFESATSFEFPSNRAALSFDMPLGNRTARNAESAARVRVRSAHLAYDQIESQIAAEVREAVRQILYQAEAVKAAAKSLELAQRQLAAEKSRQDEGLSTTFQVLEFQKQLAEALSGEKRARVAYAKALAGLAKAEGVLGEKEAR